MAGIPNQTSLVVFQIPSTQFLPWKFSTLLGKITFFFLKQFFNFYKIFTIFQLATLNSQMERNPEWKEQKRRWLLVLLFIYFMLPTVCLLPPVTPPPSPPSPPTFKRLPIDPPKTLITFPKNSYIRSNKRKPIAIINTCIVVQYSTKEVLNFAVHSKHKLMCTVFL